MIKHGMERLPAVSTVGEVLKRHGMVKVSRAEIIARNQVYLISQ
jgi:hypothetical protein